MADGITVEIFGNKAILDNLAAFEAETVARAQAMLEKAGETALEIDNDLTPVRTGYLKSRNQLDVQPGIVTVSNDSDYAVYVALGHYTRNHTSFVPPNDFLTPGMQQAGQQLMSDLEGLVS